MNDKTKILLETGTNEMELLVVIIDEQYFGLNVAKVQSILQYNPDLVTSIPAVDPSIIGMLLYRKTTIPLIDLAKILNKKQSDNIDQEIVVVTEFNNVVNSFKVHGVDQIYRLSWEKLTPLNGIIGNNSYTTGTVFLNNHEVLVLDLEYILAKLFPHLALEEVKEEVLLEQESIDRDKLKIFFAEDSFTIRKGVVNALAKAGFIDLIEFENGQIAYDYIVGNKEKNVKNTKHVVLITDIEMPQMDGLALCKYIKTDSYLHDIHVIMFSSLINKQMIAKCKSIGADNYVTKPEVNKLIHILDEFCDKK